MKIMALTGALLLCVFQRTFAQGDGYLHKNGKRTFTFGSYFLPKDDNTLKEMVDAGFNLFPCSSTSELDRLQRFNVQGWLFLPLEKGVTPAFKQLVGSVAEHPALAVWSGPDEIVWGFTTHSKLYRKMGIHHTPGAWKKQSPEALQYARRQSEIIMPNMHKAIEYLRSVDTHNRQLWINEGENSDMSYVGQFMDAVDITGCDIYPVKRKRAAGDTKSRSEIRSIGKSAKRWTVASEGKPVWMVLQGFSWNELIAVEPENAEGRPVAYPSFEESRYMAYDVLANGANGLLYWDMRYLTSEDCRQSLYSLAREFNALQPFLSTEPKPVTVYGYLPEQNADNKIVATARQYGRDWMIALVNESDTTQFAAVVKGLDDLNGLQLLQLYGEDEATVRNGTFVTRLLPMEVKVFSTSRKWEATNKKGRDYQGQ